MKDLVNTFLGQYQLTEIIQYGGMATVYKAHQPSLDRTVAIKVLLNQGNPQFVARFKREARAIAQLQHENILPIYDYGEQNGLLFFVMQYVESGITLADMLGEPMEPVRALRIMRHVLNGLGYAHERGIIHRDIKPSNILMPRADWPVLADFGIAKVVDDRQSLTMPGVIVGTAAYMAPEQVDDRPIDARTDLYAIGVVLYEMLTGRIPFDAKPPIAILKMHLQEPPPLPRSINPNLPEAIEALLLRALEKEPDQRYQSAREMAEELDQIIAQLDQSASRTYLARLYDAGADAFRQGRWTMAIERLRHVVAINPNYEDSLDLLEAAQQAQQRAEAEAQQQIEIIRQRRSTEHPRPSAPTPPPVAVPSSTMRLPGELNQLVGAEQPQAASGPTTAQAPEQPTVSWWPRIAFALIPLLLIIAVVAALFIRSGQSGTGGVLGNVGNTTSDTISGELPAPQGNVVYEDDFSQGVAKSSLDDQINAPDFGRGIQLDAYQITIFQPNEVRWVTLPRFAYTNFSLQIDLSDRSANLEGNAAQGVIFRTRDNNHFYAALIDSRNGRFAVYKQNGSQQVAIVPPTDSPLIKRQAGVNRLRVDAAGEQFTIYLNGSQLTSFSDGDYFFGLWGMIVANESANAPQMQFDNVTVWSADKPTLATGLPTVREDATGAMVLIPGGEFIMGGNAQPGEAAHIVPLPSFYIDRTEVTNEAYAQCVKAGRCTPPQAADAQTRKNYVNDPQFAKYPVINVTWQQAREYCSYAGKQLPTEAEWEKAASWNPTNRQKVIWPWGDTFDPARLNAAEAGVGDTSAVDGFPAELNGVFGMGGNVSEWTSSAYRPYPYNPADGRENAQGTNQRVVRGGAWSQDQAAARSFVRQPAAPETARNDLGFRCVAAP